MPIEELEQRLLSILEDEPVLDDPDAEVEDWNKFLNVSVAGIIIRCISQDVA